MYGDNFFIILLFAVFITMWLLTTLVDLNML